MFVLIPAYISPTYFFNYGNIPKNLTVIMANIVMAYDDLINLDTNKLNSVNNSTGSHSMTIWA